MTLTVEDTSDVGELSVDLQDGMTATGADGFERDGGEHVWDGTTDQPTLTYRWNLEQAIVGTHYEWGAITVADAPHVSAKKAGEFYFMNNQPQLNVAGNGTVADSLVVLGSYEEYERTAGDQRVRLVVPDAVEPQQSPETTVGVLARASESLSVGNDADEAHAVMTPGRSGYRSDRAFFVAEDASTTEAVRAYVTTQRDFSYTDDGRWVYTALPDYYGTQLAVKNGDVGYGPFAKLLSKGRSGAKLAELDRKIRLATDGEKTLQDAFEELNGQRGITSENFTEAVRTVSNDDVAATANDYATNQADPPTGWEDGTYEDAYGYQPANVSTTSPRFVASGASWTRSLATTDDAVVIGQPETLELRTTVRNAGGIPGRFTLTPRLTKEADSTTTRLEATGRVDAGETRNGTLTHQFEDTGRYTIRQAYDRTEIRVVPMERTATVSAIDAPAEVTAGESVNVSATVTNDQATLSRTSVPVTANGSQVANETLFVGPSAGQTLFLSITPDSTGAYPVTVGDAEATITVVADQSGDGGEAGGDSSGNSDADADGGISDAAGPGFGLSTAIAALFAGLALLAGRQ